MGPILISVAMRLGLSITDLPRIGAVDISAAPLLSAFILARNEEKNLERCLDTLRWCRDIHLVDSNSTDRTVEIARTYGVAIHQHVFEGHSKQREWALRNLPFQNEWVLALDADHRVTPELQQELMRTFATAPRNVDGFYVKRRQIFRGKWLKHGGYYPKYMLKVFKHRVAFLDHLEFDYRFYVNGKTALLLHDIEEDNRNEGSIGFFVEKHNRFATELATEELRRRQEGIAYLVDTSLWGSPDQRTLRLKQVWQRLPLYLRPLLLFVYRYVLRLGFLDGKEGFIFYFLQSFWFRLLVDIKIEEMLSSESKLIHE